MAINSPSTPVVPGRGDQDPTALTTQQINERVTALREILEARLNGMDAAVTLLQKKSDASPSIAQVNDQVTSLEKLINEKFMSIEKKFYERDVHATSIALHNKTAIDAALSALNEAAGATEKLQNEKFNSIQNQFGERDKRVDQLSVADKTAIAAALQAQKEAAGATTEMINAASNKLEGNFTKLIDQTQGLLLEVRRNTDIQINDIKSRLDKGEGRSGVRDPQMSELLDEMKSMRGTRSEGIDKTWGVVAVVATLVIAGTVAFVNRSPTAVAPQVIYVPAPVVPAPNNVSPAVPR